MKQFLEFVQFQNLKKEANEGSVTIVIPSNESEQTLEEIIDTAYRKIRHSLAQELPDAVRNLSPVFFERLVVVLDKWLNFPFIKATLSKETVK